MFFRWFLISVSISVSTLLSGCMDGVIEKEITQSKEESSIKEDPLTQWKEEPVSSEEAATNVSIESLPNVTDIENKVGTYKDAYEDLNEFSLFISDIFFKFYAGQIEVNSFVELIQPHLSIEFQKQLPSTVDGQIQMFESLQSLVSAHLNTTIVNYTASTAEIAESADTAVFYRTFHLENGEETYYETFVVLEDGVWKLQEDAPTINYQKEK